MELNLGDIGGFIAPDVVLDCTNVDSQIKSVQERMMTIKLNEQGQKDYDTWMANANKVKADCEKPEEPPTPLEKKPTTLQPVLILLGLIVGGVVIYKLLKYKK